MRFFAPLRDRTHETAARLSQIDYDREMTSGRLGRRPRGRAGPLGLPIPISMLAECAVIIRRDLRRERPGTATAAGAACARLPPRAYTRPF